MCISVCVYVCVCAYMCACISVCVHQNILCRLDGIACVRNQNSTHYKPTKIIVSILYLILHNTKYETIIIIIIIIIIMIFTNKTFNFGIGHVLI